MSRTTKQKEAARRLRVNLEADLKQKYVMQRRSLEDLANLYDVSRATVARWLDKLGIERRPRGRPRKDGTYGKYALEYQLKAA